MLKRVHFNFRKKFFLIYLLNTGFVGAYWYYPAYFYAPTTFWGEPRLAKNWLTTIDIQMRAGHAFSGFAGDGCKTEALCTYGPQNMHMVAKGVPDCQLACAHDPYLSTLWQHKSATCNFGSVFFGGRVSVAELLPTVVQNFSHGFYAGLCVPIKHIAINNLSADDQTTDLTVGNLSLNDWQMFFGSMAQRLCAYGIDMNATRNNGIGDTILFGGWTVNYEKTDRLDFLDGTLNLGVHFPTSKTVSPCCPFKIPLGSNGHYGLSFCATGALGALDWLTLSLQYGVLKTFARTQAVALRTAPEQSGWIKLARGCARVEPGTQWRFGGMIKFDHMVEGFSALLGYFYTRQHGTCIWPCDAFCASSVVNRDEPFLPWKMHSIHFAVDADFATFKHPSVPHIAFTIDKAFAGKRVLDTILFGMRIASDF